MSTTDTEQALRELKQKRAARTQLEMLQQQAELASLDLEQAAYQLAHDAEARGDLPCAARWYTAAAINDYADASLRLGNVLDTLAESHLAAREGNSSTREELDMVSEACRWYGDALGAGETEAYEFLDGLMARHFGKSTESRTRAERPEVSQPTLDRFRQRPSQSIQDPVTFRAPSSSRERREHEETGHSSACRELTDIASIPTDNER